MNVLLTGASGFIGSHLARALRAAEYVVIESRRDLDARTAAVQADFTRDLSAREADCLDGRRFPSRAVQCSSHRRMTLTIVQC